MVIVLTSVIRHLNCSFFAPRFALVAALGVAVLRLVKGISGAQHVLQGVSDGSAETASAMRHFLLPLYFV